MCVESENSWRKSWRACGQWKVSRVEDRGRRRGGVVLGGRQKGVEEKKERKLTRIGPDSRRAWPRLRGGDVRSHRTAGPGPEVCFMREC